MERLKPLKKYMVNPIHNSLCNGIFSSYFLQNFQTIFYDEEIYSQYGLLQRCFSCVSENIEQIILSKNEIISFLKNDTDYSYSERMYISNDILNLCDKIKTDNIKIIYCKNCHKIIEVFGIPYIFYFNSLEELYYQQEEILKEEKNFSNGEVIYCPRCHSKHLIHKDVYFDERGEVEYDNICKDCGYFISHFSYGSVEYAPPYQFEVYKKIFQNVCFSGFENIFDNSDLLLGAISDVSGSMGKIEMEVGF